METLIVYQSSNQTFVLHVNDEAEFISRSFGDEGIDWEEWDRFEVNGPLELEYPSGPEVIDVYDAYEI